MFDVITLTKELITRPSITPDDAGTLDFIAGLLTQLGFTCIFLPFGDGVARVNNLFAHRGNAKPHLCFAGHVDVVPTGALTAWTYPPFDAIIADDHIWGRGVCDMKGAVAAFISAIAQLPKNYDGKISLLLTGDEEGVAINGTKPALEWLKNNNLLPDLCIVGEPTSETTIADTIKIGRRGSLNAIITINGTQGHVAYPHLAHNPIHDAGILIYALTKDPLDNGHPHFDPSTLQITSVDVDNMTTNIIPAQCTVRLNIRFNANHTKDSLTQFIYNHCAAIIPNGEKSANFTMEIDCSSESFFTNSNHPFIQQISKTIANITGSHPKLSTSGGTSDARFIKNYCPVVEIGLINATIHKINERCNVNDLHVLRGVYYKTIINIV